MTTPDGPLAGVTVLDFTRVLAGPYCTRLLADLGADVLKIERREGDDTRRGYVQLEPGREDQATYFVRINVGKRSVALDLTKPQARPVVLDLARRSDVVVENFVPGVVARLGCDHATLSAVKPDLVYCSISGFGQTGPWRALQAFAHIISAVSGLMHLERNADAEPRVSYLQAADVLAGTHAFGARSAPRSCAADAPVAARTSTSRCWNASSPPRTSRTARCSTGAPNTPGRAPAC